MNLSKKVSPRQWLIWKASGAVLMHDNPAINRMLRRVALATLRGEQISKRLPSSISSVQTGDLVLHIPADGTRGSGPYYVDNATGRSRDTNRIKVALLTFGPSAWSFDLSRNEVVTVGHFDVARSERRGHAFTLEVLEQMQPLIDEGMAHFYEWFPTFPDGRTELLLSEMSAQTVRSAYIADNTATGLEADDWDNPGRIPNQIAYAVPRDGFRTYVEATAQKGKFLLRSYVEGYGATQGHYVVIQEVISYPELPADVATLRQEIARDSLVGAFNVTFGEELPEYISRSKREIARAEQEWFAHKALGVILLVRAASQALDNMDRQGHEAAIAAFTSSVFGEPMLDSLMRNSPYLTKLVADTLKDAERFRAFLTLLKELKQ